MLRCAAAVGFTFAYHSTNSVGDEDAMVVIRRAGELGQTLLDTSDVYGPHTNEQLLCACTSMIMYPVSGSSGCLLGLQLHAKALGIFAEDTSLHGSCIVAPLPSSG
jgi:hypothetical protein